MISKNDTEMIIQNNPKAFMKNKNNLKSMEIISGDGAINEIIFNNDKK